MTYILRNLLVRKVRTSLCLLGVAVSVGMIVSLLSLAHGMRQSMNSYMVESGASLVVCSRSAPNLFFSRIDAKYADQIASMDGVTDVCRAISNSFVPDRRGESEGSKRSNLPIPLVGRLFEERITKKYEDHLLEGRMPHAKSEILVGAYAAEELGLELGDRYSLFDHPFLGIDEYEVVGIFRTTIGWENRCVIVHASVVQAQWGVTDQYSCFFVFAEPGQTEPVREKIEAALPDLVAMPSGDFSEQFADQLRVIDDFVFVLTIVAVIVGVLGVLNTMMMSISERVREIGTLRAVGWSRAQVLRVIVSEGMLVAVVGGVLGLVGGYLGTEALVRWMPLGILVAAYMPKLFIQGFVLAMVVGLIGSLYPALRAANLRPAEALRYE